VIGIFLYIGAGSERQQIMLRTVLRDMPADQAMATNFSRLKPDELLSRALEHVYHGCQDDFPVVVDNQVRGVLTRTNILSTIHEKGINVPVAQVMDRDFISVDSKRCLDEVYRELVSKKKTAAVVLKDSQLQGMLGLDSISRYFMIQAALLDEGIRQNDSPVIQM